MNNPRNIVGGGFVKGSFRKKMLASAIASCTIASGFSYAQNDNAAMEEEVIVLGVKGAQISAINTKRDAQSIVDAIAAEDIGKLPDVTITDSLQRITGVQIERSAGEGGRLSIRGMQQVAVLLNGEQYLAAGNLNSAQPDFNDVPAQLLRSATVYKTLDVRNNQSGITGTIDIETFRPFDFQDGFHAAGGLDVSTGSISGETDPTLNGLIAWRNEDIGVMLSAVTGVKNLANDYAGRASGDPASRQLGPGAGADLEGKWTVTHGHGFEFFSAEDERNRDGLNAAFQANLGNGLELLVEAFYTDAVQYQRRVGLNISNRWQGQSSTSPERQAMWDERYSNEGWNGAVIATPTSASDEITGADGETWIVADTYDVEPLWIYSLTSNKIINTSSKNFNFELNYDNGGALTGGVRFIHGDAENNERFPTAQGGINSFRGNTIQQLNGHFYPTSVIDRFGLTLDPDRLDEVGVNGGRFVLPNPLGYDEDPRLGLDMNGYRHNWSGFDLPIAGGLTQNGQEASLADYMANKDSWIMEGEQFEINSDKVSSLNAISGHAKYDLQEDMFFTDVEVGLRSSRRKVDIENFDYWAQFYVESDNRLTGPDYEGANNIVGCYAQWRSIDQQFDGGSSRSECSAGERLDANDPSSFTPYFVLAPQGLDFNGQRTTFVTDLGDNVRGIPGFWAVDPRSYDNPEAYHQEVFGDIKPIVNPASSYTIALEETSAYINANFAYEDIISGSFGLRRITTDIEANLYESSGATRTNGGSLYYTGRDKQSKKLSYTLPSLFVSYTPLEDWVFRFAYAENKQDLDLDNYGSSLNISTGPSPDDATQRIPTSWSSNGSIELEPWLTENIDLSAEWYFGEGSMVSLGYYTIDIKKYVELRPEQDLDVSWSDGNVYTIQGTAPVMVNEGATVDGFEFGSKIAFSDFTSTDVLSNMGVEFNYTYSPSERLGNNEDFRSDVTGERYPFANNSEHTYNFIAWYQDEKWQARIAYNGRSERFITDYDGDYGYATYVPEEAYLDANISYDIMEDVTVYLQGANLTGEDYRQVYRLADGVEQEAFVYDNEARYAVGIRAKF